MSTVYKEVPTFDSGHWTTTLFSTRDEFKDFVKSCFKEPGQYEFDDVSSAIFREQSNLFQKQKFYCNAPFKSKDFVLYWNTQKDRCRQGVIVKNGSKFWYVSRDYYMWLNFLPIYDKEEKKFDFAKVRDAQYHMALYEQLAELHYVHSVILKKRQIASSYFHAAKLINTFWFEEGAVLKMGASLKDYINEKGTWKFLDEYKNFLNEHTAWYRPLEPEKVGAWQQRIQVRVNGRNTYKGLKSTINSYSFEKDPTNGVGGPVSYFFHEEAGIAPKMDDTYGFIKPALQSGFLTTGMFICAGSVGDLDQCEPLKKYVLYPEANSFYAVESNIIDKDGTVGKTGLFIPEQWSMPPYIDEYGNSMVKEALIALDEYFAKKKKELDPKDFQLEISQHPRNIEEAFATRKQAKFPTHLVSKQLQRIQEKEYPVEYVDMTRDGDDKIVIKHSNKLPIMEFPISMKTENKEGVICMWERPIPNVPWGTYYASIDPVGEGKAEYIYNMVHTPEGQKRIGDIRSGDFVIGSSGLSVKVLQVHPQGVKPLYRVSFSDNTSILVCEEHLWQVELNAGTRSPIVLSTKQLMDPKGTITLLGTGKNKLKNYTFSTFFKKPNGGLRWKIPLVQPIQYQKKEVPLDAYVLGLLLGDGSITGRGICFTSADQILVEEICQRTGLVARKVGKYDYRITTGKYGNSNPVTVHLKKLGLMGANSHTKFIPDQYNYASVEDRLALLQGLMDTDGYAGNHGAEYSTVSEQLAKDVAGIVQSLGGVAPIRIKKGKNCLSYNVRIKLPNGVIPFRLVRKIATYQVPSKYPAVRYITDISYEKDDEAVCLSLDSTDKLYVTEHAIVTHNTTTSDSLCSIIVYKNEIQVTRDEGNGKVSTFIEKDGIVCTWTGRYDDLKKTHERLEMIIETYNAWTLIENNVSLFIQYMISRRKQKYMVPKDQILYLKDLGANRSVYSEYGWKNTGTLFKQHLLNYGIEFLQEELAVASEDDGTIIKITYGVERIPDPMLLKEMSVYTPGLNVDRLVTFCALVAFVNVQKSNRGMAKRVEVVNDKLENSQKMSKLSMRSPFRHMGSNNGNTTTARPSRNPFRNIR